jgi:lipopolysaccharide export system permease protein
VLQILDLLDVTTDILERGLGTSGVLYYAALRLPDLIAQVAPLSVLAGGLFAFAQLARENAVIVLRATGISAYRIVAMAIPAVLTVMAIQVIAVEVASPRTGPVLAAWWRDTTPIAKRDAIEAQPFRAGGDLVVAKPGDVSGRRLTDVSIYRRDPQGRLIERIEAPSADYGKAGWTLQSPRIVRFSEREAVTSTAASMAWPTNLQPLDVQALLTPHQAASAASARRALEGGGSAKGGGYYAMQLYRAFSSPFAMLVMLLLTAPVSLANFRNREGVVLTASGLAAGLGFLVVDGLLGALGESGALSPLLAAWTATLVFGALGVTALLKMEG